MIQQVVLAPTGAHEAASELYKYRGSQAPHQCPYFIEPVLSLCIAR